MSNENLTNCPFCGKITIKVLHIPFVANTFTSKCRAGGKVTRFQKSGEKVLSGCEKCGKSQKEIEKALNEGKEISHEDRIKRMKESGLPTQIEF